MRIGSSQGSERSPGLARQILIAVVMLLSTPSAQQLTLEQIRANLLDNPPNDGDPIIREETILALDKILKNYPFSSVQEVRNFYNFMMEKVDTELTDTVSGGAVIWMMYNHGFVVKTPQIVFAFDLVSGYWSGRLPAELLAQIDVLFISHGHGDHWDNSVASSIMANGGYVVVPAENAGYVFTPMAPGDSLDILGLHIKAHYGKHNTPLRIYEVTTPGGLKIVHTGDNQTSKTLPEIDEVDILLLNAWVNESGSSSAVMGMRNSLRKLNPSIMIPGHIQELGHVFNPTESASRVPYEWAFKVADVSINSDVMVMAWGERLFVSVELVGIVKHSESPLLPKSFALLQNYPNPFNPVTTIPYQLPKSAFVNLSIYSITGQLVETIVNGYKSTGLHTVEWNAREVGSGIYFYKITAGEFTEVRKCLVLK